MSNEKKAVEALTQQWSAACLFCIAKVAGINREKISSNLQSVISYMKNDPFTRFYSEIPEKFDEMTKSELDVHKLTIENLIKDLINENTKKDIITALPQALQSAIIFASKASRPDKMVVRNRTPSKSGLSFPRNFFPALDPMLKYIEEIILTFKPEEFSNMKNDIFEIFINILFKRKEGKGPEGSILNFLTSIDDYSILVWENIAHLSKQKQTPKIQNLYNSIIDGIVYFRSTPKNVITDMTACVSQMKGKWSLPPLLQFISKTFLSITGGKKVNNYESFVTLFFMTLSKYVIDTPTEENIDMLVSYMMIISDKDFSAILPKAIQILNKNYSKIEGGNYFKYVGELFEAATGRPDIKGEIFKQFFKFWFDKKGLFNSQFQNDIYFWVNITPKIHECAPEEFTDFFSPFLAQGDKYPLFNTLLSTIHLISTQNKRNLNGITASLSPVMKNIISGQSISQELLQLVAPLMSILWQNEADMHGMITSFMTRLIKNEDFSVLRHSSSFFSDIMENYPVGTMPINIITTFATQFLKRTDVDTTAAQIVSSFSVYEYFFRSFLIYIEKNKGVIDAEQWQRVLRTTESKLIIYSYFPSNDVQQCVETIWKMCKTPVALTFEGNKPLAYKIENITEATLKEMCESWKDEDLDQRILNVAIYFNIADGRAPEFRGALAKFIYVMMKPSHFNQNDTLAAQVLPKILRVIGLLPAKEILELTLLVHIESWPLIVKELMKITSMHIRSKAKILWAMSCNRHFAQQVRANEQLRIDFANAIISFLNIRIPSNDTEQSDDTNAAEFAASFIRSSPESIKEMDAFSGLNPYSQLTQILSRLNPDSITLPDISHVFSIIELVHAYVDTWKLSDETLEGIIDWTLYVALKTKGSALLQLKCHEVLHSTINMNMESLSVIIRCCFRTSIYTTAHIASAIASSNVPANDLAILALGLCGRPNIICRAIASEIANKSAGAHFSPLSYLEPNFEESVVEYYMSSLSPEDQAYVFSRIPEVIGNSGIEPSALPHLQFIQQRFSVISRIETVEKLYSLTAITDFSNLSPIQPLIPLWDKVFKSPPAPLPEILDLLISKVPALTNARQLTATCIAFSRSFLAASKKTAQFLYSKLRVIQDNKLTFDGFVPTTEELVASAAISYIFTLETDSQRFNVCWMGQIQYLLTWAIFLRFNPLYEYYQLPPLLMSSMHAAVPSSDLPLFVMPPTQCVASSVSLPFRHSTEFTTSQMELLIATLKKFTMLTADLFIDVCADKAPSLTKYSSDFWLLFANFFQPRHSSVFLNIFMESAQAGDLETAGLMLPILTGVVKQKAPAQHVGGFIVVIIFVITTTHDQNFLKLIVKHLPGFVDAVENSADSTTISSTLEWVISEHGGQEAVVEGVLDSFISATSFSSKVFLNALSFLLQIARLLSLSDTKFSLTSGILFVFDGLRRINSGLKQSMDSHALLGIEQPSSYEELAESLKAHWPASLIPYIISYLLTWTASSAISSVQLTTDILEFIGFLTNQYTQTEYIPSISGAAAAIAHTLIGSKDDSGSNLSKQLVTLLTSLAKSDTDIPDLIKLFAPLITSPSGQKKADPNTLPRLLPKREHEATLVEVCEFIKTNILE